MASATDAAPSAALASFLDVRVSRGFGIRSRGAHQDQDRSSPASAASPSRITRALSGGLQQIKKGLSAYAEGFQIDVDPRVQFEAGASGDASGDGTSGDGTSWDGTTRDPCLYVKVLLLPASPHVDKRHHESYAGACPAECSASTHVDSDRDPMFGQNFHFELDTTAGPVPGITGTPHVALFEVWEYDGIKADAYVGSALAPLDWQREGKQPLCDESTDESTDASTDAGRAPLWNADGALVGHLEATVHLHCANPELFGAAEKEASPGLEAAVEGVAARGGGGGGGGGGGSGGVVVGSGGGGGGVGRARDPKPSDLVLGSDGTFEVTFMDGYVYAP